MKLEPPGLVCRGRRRRRRRRHPGYVFKLYLGRNKRVEECVIHQLVGRRRERVNSGCGNGYERRGKKNKMLTPGRNEENMTDLTEQLADEIKEGKIYGTHTR